MKSGSENWPNIYQFIPEKGWLLLLLRLRWGSIKINKGNSFLHGIVHRLKIFMIVKLLCHALRKTRQVFLAAGVTHSSDCPSGRNSHIKRTGVFVENFEKNL